MTTKTHRAVRKIAPFLNRIEPFAMFVAYSAAGIMAYFAWFFPPKVAAVLGEHSILTQSILLTIGAVLGLFGHIGKKSLIEFWGLLACGGGIFITLCGVLSAVVDHHQYNYGQFAGLILMTLGLMFSHGYKLYHDITESWINAPAPMIDAIYQEK